MNDDYEKVVELPTNEKPLHGEELLKYYAQIATTDEEKEEDHQGCLCCQGKNR